MYVSLALDEVMAHVYDNTNTMGAIKQIHIVAKEIAEDITKQINKQCDWQVDQFLPPNSEGKIIDEAHSYMARTVARHVANAFDVNTNKYYDE